MSITVRDLTVIGVTTIWESSIIPVRVFLVFSHVTIPPSNVYLAIKNQVEVLLDALTYKKERIETKIIVENY